MSKISVIVPIYKVEKYLARCIDSILNQTYRNLEIILVDDGSPDACGMICDQYAQQDSRIRVIHKENGGLSSARNAGIAIATGTYIGFVDSDDYILPQMYERLHAAMVETSAEIGICNYAYIDEETGIIDDRMMGVSPIKNEILSREQVYEKIDTSNNGYSFFVTAWNKLYKKEVFAQYCFWEGKLHEDEFIVHHLFEQCCKIVTISDVLYMYVQRRGSIMNTNVTVKSLDAVYALYDRYHFYEERGYAELAKAVLYTMYWKMKDLLSCFSKEGKVEINKAVRMVLKTLFLRKNMRLNLLMIEWIKYLWRTR